MSALILAVDRAFTPDRWLDAQAALSLIGRGAVQQTFGDTVLRLRGGTNAKTGRQSILDIGAIMVVDTKEFLVSDFSYAPYERQLLFSRDKNLCAYCGQVFRNSELEVEHVTPECQDGKTVWENLVSSCHACNQRKGGRRPEQAGMELLYVPYRPNRHEYLILKNRNIVADQMDFLLAGVPEHSRLRS